MVKEGNNKSNIEKKLYQRIPEYKQELLIKQITEFFLTIQF